MKSLAEFISAIRRNKNVLSKHWKILALDPGETTGYAYIHIRTDGNNVTDINVVECDQIGTWPEKDCVENMSFLLDHIKPDIVVNESYRVYDWKSDDHKWSPVNTTQVIGCIWTLLHQRDIPRVEQSAQIAKGFWTDDRLTEFDLWIRGKRHGRDGLRHALYFICFGGEII